MKKKAKYPVAGVGQLREILAEQNEKCALTGDQLTPNNTSFDHKLPLARGGSSLKDNLQAVTKQINTSKSNFTMNEYLEICFKVLNHAGKNYGYKATKKKIS